MKKILLLLTIILSVILLTGCGSNKEVKQLAIKESEMLKESTAIANEINNSYNKWKSGQIDREQLSEELSKNYSRVKNLESKWDNSKASMSREARCSAAMWKINYMGNICYDLEHFIIDGTQGYPSSVIKSGKKPLSDSELKNSYEVNMVNSFNRNTERAIKGIDEITKYF